MNSKRAEVFIEMMHLGSAQGANSLARMMPDGSVMVETPRLFAVSKEQMVHELGGLGEKLVAIVFSIEGDGSGQLWWVVSNTAASAIDSRIQRSSSTGKMALVEAANIVASAVLSGIGTLAHAHYLPSTPEIRTASAFELAQAEEANFSLGVSAKFSSMNSPFFSGRLLLFFDVVTENDLLARVSP